MTIEECYEALHGDYAEVKTRLMTEKLVTRFLLKFPGDPTMKQLRDAVDCANIPDSFRAAHTLKGVAANLAFKDLQAAASELTEQLRPQTDTADPALFAAVEAEYARVISAIESFRGGL